MEFVQSCSHKNDEAISLIHQGKYKEAIQAFTRTLALVQTKISERGNAPVEQHEGEAAEPGSCLCWHYCRIPTQASEDLPELFDFVVSISPRTGETSSDATSESVYLELSQGLIFNTALSHHIGALDGNLHSSSLKKAKTLYQLAKNMLVSDSMNLPLAHQMAVLNNLGQLHALHNHQNKARHYFDQLLELVIFARQRNEYLANDDGDGDDIFLKNALQSQSIGECAPAA